MVTALSNDVGFEVVFARQLAAFARPGDVAVGLSTSGGSANVLAAFAEARRLGLVTVGFAGYDGGRMAEAAAAGAIDHLFVVPSASVHRIQEAQTTTYHVLWELTQSLSLTPGRASGSGGRCRASATGRSRTRWRPSSASPVLSATTRPECSPRRRGRWRR